MHHPRLFCCVGPDVGKGRGVVPQGLKLLMVQGLLQEAQLFGFGLVPSLQHFEIDRLESPTHNLAHLGFYVQQPIFQRCCGIPQDPLGLHSNPSRGPSHALHALSGFNKVKMFRGIPLCSFAPMGKKVVTLGPGDRWYHPEVPGGFMVPSWGPTVPSCAES